VGRCKSAKVERWRLVGEWTSGLVGGERQEAVERCKSAKVERWKSVGGWTSGLVGGADAKRKVAGAIGKDYLFRLNQR